MPLCHGLSLGAQLRVHCSFGDQPRRWRLELFLSARRTLGTIVLLCLLAIALSKSAYGAIYYNSASPNAGQVIPGTQGITPGPGIDLSNWNTSGHVLTYASLSNFNLANATFADSFLGSADLGNSDLTGAVFVDSDLRDAKFNGAIIKRADFSSTSTQPYFSILTFAQLQSTASYAAGDLSGISLAGTHLDYWDFRNQNLSNANLSSTTIVGASFGGANLTNANLSRPASFPYVSYYPGTDFSNANLTNADLTNVSFVSSSLANANFTGATIKGANFSTLMGFGPEFTATQLYSTRSYAVHDLSGIALNSDEEQYDLSGWNFAHQNLTNAGFKGSKLTNADFTGAIVNGADFSWWGFDGTLSAGQLYSTASYASHNLSGIKLAYKNLDDWNFANQNLTNAKFNTTILGGTNFKGAILNGADFTSLLQYPTLQVNADYTDADLRGAAGWVPIASTITHNTIRPNGSIQGLALLTGEKLVVRNNPLAVTVTTSATFDPASTLGFMLDQNWTSPVGFATGLTPMLSGALDLEIASGTDPSTLVGTTFQLFNWNGPLPSGDQFSSFTTAPGLTWDLTNLYSTGTVTLTSVPEPSTALMVAIGLSVSAMLARRRKCGFFRPSRWGARRVTPT